MLAVMPAPRRGGGVVLRPHHLGGGHTVKSTIRGKSVQEPAGMPRILARAGRDQPPLHKQIALEASEQHLARQARLRDLLRSQHARPTQHLLKANNCATRPGGAATATSTLPTEKLIYSLAVQVRGPSPSA